MKVNGYIEINDECRYCSSVLIIQRPDSSPGFIKREFLHMDGYGGAKIECWNCHKYTPLMPELKIKKEAE